MATTALVIAPGVNADAPPLRRALDPAQALGDRIAALASRCLAPAPGGRYESLRDVSAALGHSS